MSAHNSLLGLKNMDMKPQKDESISEQSIYDRYETDRDSLLH